MKKDDKTVWVLIVETDHGDTSVEIFSNKDDGKKAMDQVVNDYKDSWHHVKNIELEKKLIK